MANTPLVLPPPAADVRRGCYHAVPVDRVLVDFGTAAGRGLTATEAADRLARYGNNELAEPPGAAWWRRLGRQFNELLIWILVAAAVISGLLAEWADALAILAIVVLNGILGFVQEERSGRALAALRQLAAQRSKVVRDGRARVIPSRELVPGDWVELDGGDHVPADVRLVRTAGLRAQESALTGESVPVGKLGDACLPADTPLAERRNMAYMGTVVVAGQGAGVVVATGMGTEIGRIAGMLRVHAEPQPTPLQRTLAHLGKVLMGICVGVVILVAALHLWRGGTWLQVLLLSVSLAVAAIPEGLPAVITIALAVGMRRMVRRNALIRTLPSVETLGCVTAICSDKTGTLTRNEMTVREVSVGRDHYRVTGSGYAPVGQFLRRNDPPGGTETPVDLASVPELVRAMTISAVCGHARVQRRADGTWEAVGDPTEAALVVAAMKVNPDGPPRVPDTSVLHEIPFDSERKMMSVVVREPDGTVMMYTKGAPEVVLGHCVTRQDGDTAVPLTRDGAAAILADAAAMASRSLRVMALAFRPVSGDEEPYTENGLTFAGLAGMMDPPRDEARDAVRRCRQAGIRPVMITGDHPATALAIARELDIASDTDRAVSGAELDRTADDALVDVVRHVSVYARVTAEHKLRLVRALRTIGEITAMTGDGVNDAPAIQAADIGIAMGRTGTDVTRAASDMVLVDDNFASIVNAVEEGRGIFDNARKVVQYLLACNAGEILFVLSAPLAGWPVPLLPIQILWINLVTDSLPALALGVDPVERDVMSRPPRPAREPFITGRRGTQILLHGMLIAAATASAFRLFMGNDPANLPRARTAAFFVLAFSQLLYAFACRSRLYTLPQLGPLSNPRLLVGIAAAALIQLTSLLPLARSVFKTVPDLGTGWVAVLALSLGPVTVIEVAKLLRARTTGEPSAGGR